MAVDDHRKTHRYMLLMRYRVALDTHKTQTDLMSPLPQVLLAAKMPSTDNIALITIKRGSMTISKEHDKDMSAKRLRVTRPRVLVRYHLF